MNYLHDMEIGLEVYLIEDEDSVTKVSGKIIATETIDGPDTVIVRWNPGHNRVSDMEIIALDLISSKEEEDLNSYFIRVAKSTQIRLTELIEEATSKFQEAVALSNETGIPFYSELIEDYQTYIPDSMYRIFPNIRKSLIAKYAKVIKYDLDNHRDNNGWQPSAVC